MSSLFSRLGRTVSAGLAVMSLVAALSGCATVNYGLGNPPPVTGEAYVPWEKEYNRRMLADNFSLNLEGCQEAANQYIEITANHTRLIENKTNEELRQLDPQRAAELLPSEKYLCGNCKPNNPAWIEPCKNYLSTK